MKKLTSKIQNPKTYNTFFTLLYGHMFIYEIISCMSRVVYVSFTIQKKYKKSTCLKYGEKETNARKHCYCKKVIVYYNYNSYNVYWIKLFFLYGFSHISLWLRFILNCSSLYPNLFEGFTLQSERFKGMEGLEQQNKVISDSDVE